MQGISNQRSALRRLARPMALVFVGVLLLSIGAALLLLYLYQSVPALKELSGLLLQSMPLWARAALFLAAGLGVLALGLWHLRSLALVSLDAGTHRGELVLGYERPIGRPRLAVVSGGAGMLILASLGRVAERLTCITPVQDPVEYYYRASNLFHFQNVIFVVPTPEARQVQVTLDDGRRMDIKENITHDELLARRHAVDLALDPPIGDGAPLEVTQVALDALAEADAIILGPGSLFETILPNMLIPALRDAVRRSKAPKIYICNLMTEPGLTTGFSVADHIRQLVRFSGFAPDYVLVNTPRIESDVRQVYAAANQNPVYLTPEEYEETAVRATADATTRDLVLEGALVVEADLASAVVQLTASLDNPGDSRTVRVLRHDPDKLAAAIMEILRRG